jgi:endoglucanase
LKQAVTKLKANSSTKVYIDSGHAKWKSADEMADRLNKSGIALADGFSLNVSNYITTADNISYGQQISAKVRNKHFVIDTSRNGNGPTQDNQWCNPSGRALGTPSTIATLT